MKIKTLVICSLLTALLSVSSMLIIPIGSIPVTMSLLALFIIGGITKPQHAVLIALIYIGLGACGLPIFAGFVGGIGAIAAQTGGFILSYPVAVGVQSAICYNAKKASTATLLLSEILSLTICYFIGALWFCFVTKTGFVQSLLVCVLPFIAFDLIKAVISVLVIKQVKKHIHLY